MAFVKTGAPVEGNILALSDDYEKPNNEQENTDEEYWLERELMYDKADDPNDLDVGYGDCGRYVVSK